MSEAPRAVKMVFVELEAGDEAFFDAALAEHDLVSLRSLADVPPDTEVISGFINSAITPDFLDSHRAVRLVATRSTTWDHIDLPACAQRGVTVCGIPSYGDHTVAEHAFALILALARRLRDSLGAGRNGSFSYEALRGVELRGKTLGIIGAGRVGRAMIPIAHGFGMEVIFYEPDSQTSAPPEHNHRVSFDELLRRSHVISLHARLNPATYHILDRASFAKCRRGVLIINTARGRLIDTAALAEAMDAGIVAGAGFDVLGEESIFHKRATAIIGTHILHRLRGEAGGESTSCEENEPFGKLLLLEKLLARSNVVFTPHTAFNTVEATERINRMTVENIRAFLAGSPINVLPPTTVQAEPKDGPDR
jgi:D-lactate dehydrogenase